MAREEIESLLRWLNPKAEAEYVLLTPGVYSRLKKSWGLPDMEAPAKTR
jgi:hypothetical protein